MLGSILTRVFIMVLGYAYPAYECFKSVEKNKADIEQLRFWCQYWILVAALTIFERVGDAFIAWAPMYSEAKLAFFIYLWYPKTRGTTYVYNTFFRPYILMHEEDIDRSLFELKARAGNAAGLFFQKAAIYGQTRFYEILQYLASQSQQPGSQPGQGRLQHTSRPPPIVATAQPPEALIQQQAQLRASNTPSTSVKNETLESKQEAASDAPAPPAPARAVSMHTPSQQPTPADAQVPGPSNSKEVEHMEVEQTSGTEIHVSNPQPRGSILEGIRARLRHRTLGGETPSNH